MNLKNFNIPPGAKEIKIAIPPKLAQLGKVFDPNDPIEIKIITLYKDDNGDWISDDPDVELLDTAVRINGEITIGAQTIYDHKFDLNSISLKLSIDIEELMHRREEFYKRGMLPEKIIIELNKVGATLFGLPIEFRMKE
jgi:hypothetical protein